MASKTHVRSAVVTACVNCHRSSSTVGAVSVKRGSDGGGIDSTPLTWFQMLRAVGLATCGRAPATGGTMCVGVQLGRAAACQRPTPAIAGIRGSAMWQLPPSSAPGLEGRIVEGSVHFQQMLRETKKKSKKFRIQWSKVPRVLEPLNSSYGHCSHPGGHGRFKPKNTQTGNKSRFPGATCIFSKCCARQKRRARNSASDGQKYRAFWSP